MFRVKNVTKKIMKKLPEIIKEKNLKIDDLIYREDYDTDLESNNEALRDLLTTSLIKIPKDRKCYFLEGNRAWGQQSTETENFLYCSINDKGERFCLTLYSIFEIFINAKQGVVETAIMNTYGFRTREEEVKGIYIGRCLKNIEIINNNNWKREYPILYKEMFKAIKTLKVLNYEALDNVLNYYHDVDGEHCFFSSTRYLVSKVGKGDSTISLYINYLTLLGFIEKVDEERIPQRMKEHHDYRREGKMAITVMIMKEITDELLKEAERRIIKILEIDKEIKRVKLDKKFTDLLSNKEHRAIKDERAKLGISTATEKKIEQYFGKEEALRVFPNNRILIDSRKEMIERRKEEKKMIEALFKNIEESGFPF